MNFDINDLNDLEPSEFELRLARIKMKDLMLTDEERVSPDTFGCDCYFLRYFLTSDMDEEFNLIAKDFFQHEFKNLSNYCKLKYIEDHPEKNYPEQSFQFLVLNLMMGAVRSGSEFARAQFCYLHKIFYKKEYQLLKRFSSISAEEVLSVAKIDKLETTSPAHIARILFMAEMYGIEIKKDCSFLYLYIEELNEESQEEISEEYGSLPEEILNKARDTMKEWFPNTDDITDDLQRTNKFIKNVLKYFTYDEDYIFLFDNEYFDAQTEYEKTYAIYKTCYPNKKLKKEDLTLYVAIFRCINTLISTCDNMYEVIGRTLGVSEPLFYEEQTFVYKPEQVKLQNPIPTREVKTEVKKQKQDDIRQGYSESALLHEIDALREKLHKAEEEKEYYKNMLHNKTNLLKEQENLYGRYEEERAELIALRNHVYRFTESDVPSPSSNLEQMKTELKEHSVVIIGGHVNWISKLRAEFPSWTFISYKASGTVDKNLLKNAEYVYFFTDTISHSVYYRYIQIVREQKIRFGYIHSVNIIANIGQLYEDLCSQ